MEMETVKLAELKGSRKMAKVYVLGIIDDDGSLASIHGTTQDDTIADTWDAAGGVVYVTDSNEVPSRDSLTWRDPEN